MKRTFPLLLLALSPLLLTAPATAQSTYAAPAAAQEEEIPQWLADLSNLPREQRAEYISNFSQAKTALTNGDWVSCDAALTTCELIFSGNPNIWNMRAACYIEQKRYKDAAEEVAKAKAALPHDASTLVNIATLHMVQGEYQECIKEMSDIIDSNLGLVRPEVLDILTFRVFLCHLMLGNMADALDLVQDISPLSDTPLYYYSRAAVCLHNKDVNGAKSDLQSATRIFRNQPALLVPYQRALMNCNMAVPEKRSATVGEESSL